MKEAELIEKHGLQRKAEESEAQIESDQINHFEQASPNMNVRPGFVNKTTVERIKSPSDTTIYAPAMHKTPD